MSALTGYPPPSVLGASLERADEDDEAIEDLVVSTGLKIAGLLDRLEHAHRPRTELIEDWRTVQSLAAHVPALTELAAWLLDQIALRDLPEALAPVAAAQTQRRAIEAFGTPERAAQAWDGQIHYQLQQPVAAHRRAQTDLLTCARDALQHLANADVPLDAEQICACLGQAMARPAASAPAWPRGETRDDQRGRFA
ncbi:hypothetical protein ACWCPJ_35905 [Streptomyces collinus]